MNPAEDTLSKALRELSAASPQGAPPEVGDRLRGAFARHHSRRRRKQIALTTATVLCLLIAFGWLRLGKPARPDTTVQQQPTIVRPSVVPPAAVAQATGTAKATPRMVAHAPTKRAKGTAKTYSNGHRPSPAVVATSDFVVLSSFDPAVPVGQSRLVRLELPGSALQLIGCPVNEELLQRRVLTDVLVGQDGLPYAVRLVQTRAIH